MTVEIPKEANPPASGAPPSIPSPSSAPPPPQLHWLHPRRATGRVIAAMVAGVGAGLFLFDGQSWAARVVGGWDCGAFTLLSLQWHVIWTSDPVATRRRASTSDPGRSAAWILALVASAFSLFAGAVVLRRAADFDAEQSQRLAALCLIAVATAWNVTHTSYTLRYAHLYYRDDSREGGLTFPGPERPDDFDFAYFAYTVGMTFQVSDVVITSPAIRRTVLTHAVLSFAYNTVIFGLVLNLFVNFLN